MGHLENLYFYVWISFCLFVCFFNRTPTFFNSIQVYLYCKVTTLYNNAIIRCSVELKQLTQIEKNFFLVDFFPHCFLTFNSPMVVPTPGWERRRVGWQPYPTKPKNIDKRTSRKLEFGKTTFNPRPKARHSVKVRSFWKLQDQKSFLQPGLKYMESPNHVSNWKGLLNC